MPIKARKIVVIISIGAPAPASASPSLSPATASSSRELIAKASPEASGSIVRCQPARVVSTQSDLLAAHVAGFDAAEVAGNDVASFNQISAISNAFSTTAKSFVPRGARPWAETNLFALSRTVAWGKTSPGTPGAANIFAKGFTKPGELIPSFSNCSFICSCMARIMALKSGSFPESSGVPSGVKPKGDMCAPFWI